jgi:Protein of unknown function (DUF3579)
MPDALREIIIIGITESGTTFRPSDWAERLCGVMSLFGEDQRISYLPLVRPIVSAGVHCAVVDRRLEELRPEAFGFSVGFARDNELRLRAGRDVLRPPASAELDGAAAAVVDQTRFPPVAG